MRCEFIEADVRHQVPRGLHTETVPHHGGGRPLPVPRVRDAMVVEAIEDGNPGLTPDSIWEKIAQLTATTEVTPSSQIPVVVLPGTSPGRPSPDMRVPDEAVTPVLLDRDVRAVVARHVHHAFVILVPREDIVAERKEFGMRDTVVLEDDALPFVLEEPVDGPDDADPTTQVDRGVVGEGPAGPVNKFSDELPDLFNGMRLVGGPGAVSGYVESSGTNIPESLEDSPRLGWTVPHDEEHRALTGHFGRPLLVANVERSEKWFSNQPFPESAGDS